MWTGKTLWEIELDGQIVEERSKVVASRGRLVRRIDAWENEVRDAISRDPKLTAEQRRALLNVYESFVSGT